MHRRRETGKIDTRRAWHASDTRTFTRCHKEWGSHGETRTSVALPFTDQHTLTRERERENTALELAHCTPAAARTQNTVPAASSAQPAPSLSPVFFFVTLAPSSSLLLLLSFDLGIPLQSVNESSRKE